MYCLYITLCFIVNKTEILPKQGDYGLHFVCCYQDAKVVIFFELSRFAGCFHERRKATFSEITV